jgi:MFS family permease
VRRLLVVPVATTVLVWLNRVAATSRSTSFADEESVAIVTAMMIIGSFVALVVGGLLGQKNPLRWLGALSLVPFTAMLAVFAMFSGCWRRDYQETQCSVTTFLRYGSIVAALGCCSVAAVASGFARRHTET